MTVGVVMKSQNQNSLECFMVNYQYKPSKDWRHDWKKCLPEKVDSYEPCFLLFRFDSSHEWILIR
jgi:hypothetical protein